jgi:hypothetical protein
LIINEIHIWGEKLLYSHFSPYLPRGENGWKIYYIAIFPLFAKGGNGWKIYYIAIFPPIQVRGK